MLERKELRSLKGTSDKPLIRWQTLRRATNQLLTLPARHRLMADLLKTRVDHVLSVSEISALSQSAWKYYFADSVDGFDQYV